MHKSNWHLKTVIAATVIFMSLGSALMLTQLAQPSMVIPEMLVPFHATAPVQTGSDGCHPTFDTMSSGYLEAEITHATADVPILVEIYSRDAAARLPNVTLNHRPRQTCLTLDGEYVSRRVVPAVVVGTISITCDHTDTVAYKVG